MDLNQTHLLETSLFHQFPLQLRHSEWLPAPYRGEFEFFSSHPASPLLGSDSLLSDTSVLPATPLPILSILSHRLCVFSSRTQVLLLSPAQSSPPSELILVLYGLMHAFASCLSYLVLTTIAFRIWIQFPQIEYKLLKVL